MLYFDQVMVTHRPSIEASPHDRYQVCASLMRACSRGQFGTLKKVSWIMCLKRRLSSILFLLKKNLDSGTHESDGITYLLWWPLACLVLVVCVCVCVPGYLGDWHSATAYFVPGGCAIHFM